MQASFRRIGLTTTVATLLVLTTIALPALADPYSAEAGVSEDAEGTVAVSVWGDADGDAAGVSVFGNSSGTVAATVDGHSQGGVAVGADGAEGEILAVSNKEDSNCTSDTCAAVNGQSDANGGLAAASVFGDATCSHRACAAANVGGGPFLPSQDDGDADGGVAAVSVFGDASCQSPCVAAAPTGTASCEHSVGRPSFPYSCVAVGNETETEEESLVMVGTCEGVEVMRWEHDQAVLCWNGW